MTCFDHKSIFYISTSKHKVTFYPKKKKKKYTRTHFPQILSQLSSKYIKFIVSSPFSYQDVHFWSAKKWPVNFLLRSVVQQCRQNAKIFTHIKKRQLNQKEHCSTSMHKVPFYKTGDFFGGKNLLRGRTNYEVISMDGKTMSKLDYLPLMSVYVYRL